MKMNEVNPYDTIQVAKIRKRNNAKRIIKRWPTWKQEVGYPSLSNVRGKT
jgi:hypothetical protein